MARQPGKAGGHDAKAARDARLKEALRANLKRRKAQAKARAATTDGDGRTDKG